MRRNLFFPFAVASAIGFLLYVQPHLWSSVRLERLSPLPISSDGRPVEGRLSWDTPYAPWLGNTKASWPHYPESVIRAQVARTEREPHGHGLAVRGVIQLVRGQTQSAIDHLQKASVRIPQRADIWSDLAAAYLDQGAREKSPYYLALAVESAERALRIEPLSAPAIFNAALALEYLCLGGKARERWTLYLSIDPNSEWAVEARSHLNSIDNHSSYKMWEEQVGLLRDAAKKNDIEVIRRIASDFPQESWHFVEETLLGAWAHEIQRNQYRAAASTLDLARRISTIISDATNDHLSEDSIAVIDSSQADSLQLLDLVTGHSLYSEARRLHVLRRPVEAARKFERAQHALVKAGSPAANCASLYLAIGKYERFQLVEANVELEHLIAKLPHDRYPGLVGRVGWALGMVNLASGKPLAAMQAYHTALNALEFLGAAEDAASVHSLIAESMGYLGNAQGSWVHTYAALRLSSKLSSRRQHAIYAITGDALLAADRLWAAYLFRDEAVQVARLSKQPVGIAHALVQRSQILARLGRVGEAYNDLFSARRVIQRIQDNTLRDRVEADLCVSEADLNADSNYAVTLLGNAINFYAGRESRYPLVPLYLARARLRLKTGDAAGAESDLHAGIYEVERQRRNIREEGLQMSFFDRSQDIFEEMLYFQAIFRGLSEESFDWSERVRARTLLDKLGALLNDEKKATISREAGETVTFAEVQRQLEPNVTIVSFLVLRNRLLIWLVRVGKPALLIAKPISEARLASLILKLRMSIGSSRGSAFRDTSAILYDVLVRPYQSQIGRGSRIVFVPAKDLHSVPFAALYNRESGRYLVQDHIVTIAPSASYCLRFKKNFRSSVGLRALVIGNPEFSRAMGGDLPMLPWAEREAEKIVKIIPGNLMVGKEATVSRFMSEANQYDIVHFAGHAIQNEKFPLLSYLLLAEDMGSDGILYGHDIYDSTFGHTRLVVLAACNTATGKITSEGMLSLAQAFIHAGVSQVVASLWRVDDRSSSELFNVFYSRLVSGNDPEGALQEAQLSMLFSVNPAYRRPESWSGFQLVGGLAPNRPVISKGVTYANASN